MTVTALRTTVTAAVLSAGVLAVAVPIALAADLAAPTTTTENGQTVMALDDTETGSKFVPKGGQPTDEFPNHEPAVGDGFTFTDDLFQDGVLVGQDQGHCTIVSAGEAGKGDCDVTLKFKGGAMTAQGVIAFTDDGTPFTVPVKEGTGVYKGVKGTATVVDLTDEQDPSDKKSTITLRFTLPAEGSQVAEVPAGGADTGGGLSDGVPVELLAIGAAAIVTGVGIADVGRRVRGNR